MAKYFLLAAVAAFLQLTSAQYALPGQSTITLRPQSLPTLNPYTNLNNFYNDASYEFWQNYIKNVELNAQLMSEITNQQMQGWQQLFGLRPGTTVGTGLPTNGLSGATDLATAAALAAGSSLVSPATAAVIPAGAVGTIPTGTVPASSVVSATTGTLADPTLVAGALPL